MTFRLLTLMYLVISIFLYCILITAPNGTGLGVYIIFWIFQVFSWLVVGILVTINSKKWFGGENDKNNKVVLLFYIIIPLLMILFMGVV